MYVDDFKLAGKAANIPKARDRLKQKIDLDPAVPIKDSVYLGCGQQEFVPPPHLLQERTQYYNRLFHNTTTPPHGDNDTGGAGRSGQPSSASQTKHTGGVGGSGQPSPASRTVPTVRGESGGSTSTPRAKAYQYNMEGHAEGCVEKYLELANKELTSLSSVSA